MFNVKTSMLVLSSLICLCTKEKADTNHDSIEFVEWDNSLALPAVDGAPSIGVAGAYAGFIGEALIVAGGANFPDAMPWDGGGKKWHKSVYITSPDDEEPSWEVVEDALPRPLAYGISIELPEGILCIGGCDAGQCYKDVFLLNMKDGRLQADADWPPLPVPLANAAGALLDRKIYVAGGQEQMDAQKATNHFFVLDLDDKEKGWAALQSWPGPPRGYAVSAVQSDGRDDCFYLFSGRDYDETGKLDILTDGYAYNPRLGAWRAIDQRFPVMAGTAIASGANHIIFFGGSSKIIPGSDDHPGFDNVVRLYDTATNTFIDEDTIKYDIPLTTAIARKGPAFYFASGEIKPGVRTPVILRGEMEPLPKRD